MLIDVIREFNRAVPFLPYEIRTNGGERLRVPHPDFIFVAPRGTWVIVTDEKDRPRNISTILIEEVSPLRKRSPGKRNKRSDRGSGLRAGEIAATAREKTKKAAM